MGKRRSKTATSTSSSHQSTPKQSDSDDDIDRSGKTQPQIVSVSAKLCASLGMKDVPMEWSEADYQNLTTFNMFTRMVRHQLAANNPKVAAAKMNQVLEAKWKEFQESNPLNKKAAPAKERQAQPMPGDNSDEEDEIIEQRGDSSESDENVADSVSQEDGDDDEEEEREMPTLTPSSSRASSRAQSGLRVKLTIKPPSNNGGGDERDSGQRKGTRDRRSTKTAMSDKEFEKMLVSDEESGSEDNERRKRKRKKPNNSDSDDFEASSHRRRSSAKRQKRPPPPPKDDSGSEGGSISDDEDTNERNKRSKREKKRTNGNIDDANNDAGGSGGSEEDTDMDSDDGQGKGKKKKKRDFIPGERKSIRSRRSNASMVEMTDKDFERMLAEQEKEQSVKQQSKRESVGGEKKGRSSTNSKKGRGGGDDDSGEEKKKPKRKPIPPREKKGGESGNESDHLWYCELCRDGGDLLLCDTCPKSFHKECLKLDIVPDGDWSCPVCTGEGLPELGDTSEEEEEADKHDTLCRACNDGGDLLLCDFCTCVYHKECVKPPLASVPDGNWRCPVCVIRATPLKGKVKQILTWRWTNQPKDADELDHTHSQQDADGKAEDSGSRTRKKRKQVPERELYVKYEFHSYWDCEWISELALEVHQPLLHNMSFRRKFDLNEPPALEDGSSFGRPRHKAPSATAEGEGSGEGGDDDQKNLEARYYRYGIKPEWLQIHRIITHEGKGKERRFLVKWRELAYVDCTWEYPEDIPEGLEGFEKHVEAYWDRRRLKMKEDPKRSEIPKKSLLRKKLEKQPAILDATGGQLHPYQLEGLNWLRFSWSQDTNTILADEMGLGKTIQAITFIYSLWREGYITKPILISAPLSTVPNWEREFEFWAPEMYVVTYCGGKENVNVIREREFCFEEGCFSSLQKPCRMRDGYKPKFDALLTSYEYVSHSYATLSSIDWSILIIDEAHRLKNNQSLFFRTLSDFKINYKLLLTGTPLQNNLEELFNLLNFLEPGKFVNMELFLSEFSEISRDEQVLKLHDMLAPHMLRRMKMDVLKDIPAKSEFIVRIELSPMQKKFYKHILTKNYEALNCKGYGHQTSLMNIMMDLRKCCNHPYLFPGAEKDAVLTNKGMYEGTNLTKASGKLEMLASMLKILKRDGHRVLIFSQMTRMLDILEDFLAFYGYGYERIDGSIAGGKRQESIDRFNSTESHQFVFLLSTRAGGLGINLATADTVIIFDMDWNPHNDIQAFSRAHRIGQKNQVMIYRYVSRNTVEEKIAQVCKSKMMLSELIVHRGMGNSGPNVEKKDSLTKQEISDILKYGAENLFKDDEEGQVVYSSEAIEKLLDRNQVDEEEKEKEFGMNEYLRSFKVASYQVKEDDLPEPAVEFDEDGEEKEEKEEEPAAGATHPPGYDNSDRRENETDDQYWQRVLGSAYNDHVVQTLREQEEVAKTLGKGKRIRKQINYAEREMMEASTAEFNNKRKKVVQDEDVAFQSDYEPTSDSSEEEGSGQEDENGEKKKAKLAKSQQPRQPQVSLPPLVERTAEGQVLVLGFTARQRRAFLDAVMRYGMPPSDPYRSQWLVRDLRSKPERIFKAFVSLFMRHLCEPIAETADKFADGVPREGLSRQHVLTRIGIIALIRKKVHEFEDINGIDSMAEFKSASTNSSESGTTKTSGGDGTTVADITDTTTTNAETDLKDSQVPDTEKMVTDDKSNTEKKNETDDKPDSNGVESKTSAGTDEKMETDGDTAKGVSTKSAEEEVDADTEKTAVAKTKESLAEVGVDAPKESMMEVESGSTSKEEDAEKSKEISSVQNLTDDDKVNCISEEIAVPKSDESPMILESAVLSLESVTVAEVKEATADDPPKDASDSAEGTGSHKPAVSEASEDVDTMEKTATAADVDSSLKLDKADSPNAANNKAEDKIDDLNNSAITDDMKVNKVIDSSEDSSSVDKTERSSDENKDKTAAETDKGEEGTKKDESSVIAEGATVPKVADDATKPTDPIQPATKDILLTSVMTPAEIAAELRKRFWIADGGFTELHSLWQMEEQQLVKGKEYETWHRRHDFWLLAGVITHGYRHWQDILSDPRFDLMNQAFRSDSERTRKAAFLNRRFQLLEQSLVIEEQLRKSAAENDAAAAANSTQPTSRTDHLQQLDELAETLKKLGHGDQKGVKNPKMTKVFGQISSLVSDINDMSYTNMPASLAKAYVARVNVPPKPTAPVLKQPMVGANQWGPYKSVMPGGTKPMYIQQPLPYQGFKGSSPAAGTSKPVDKSKQDVICID